MISLCSGSRRGQVAATTTAETVGERLDEKRNSVGQAKLVPWKYEVLK